ncbi:MAG: PHP domain-containing protein [Clostridia bacterium]|nr:PHP domain-containing protein [Eubacteriales bacterium]MDO5586653.1 PHP domain-containing protein [Clostridia bacterium]
MKLYYDFHIHSALSPCGDNDMTPNNLINMSIIKGLDAVALTDHNACENVRAAAAVAGDKIIFIPGMEVETSEEVHIVTLFPTADAAEEMQRILVDSSPFIPNRPEIFGNQYIMDENDEICGEIDRMLVTASGLDIYTVVAAAKDLGGIAYPAHIDRESYSVLSNLGFIPPDLDISAVEITEKSRTALEGEYSNRYNIITSSDAHYLWDISERNHYIEVSDASVRGILNAISNRLS